MPPVMITTSMPMAMIIVTEQDLMTDIRLRLFRKSGDKMLKNRQSTIRHIKTLP